MGKVLGGLVLALLAGSAGAAAVSSDAADPALTAVREAFLAAGIGAMMACGLASFVLAGRVAERTHVALAMLAVLVGAFCLFAFFGLTGHASPEAGAVVLLGLIGLFKLMSQFEIRRRR
jgi:peptidoglycan/LPS O-acetylase OafA/YrhL